jgi:hypothetical protein
MMSWLFLSQEIAVGMIMHPTQSADLDFDKVATAAPKWWMTLRSEANWTNWCTVSTADRHKWAKTTPALRRNGENDDGKSIEYERHQHDDTTLWQRMWSFYCCLEKDGRGAVKSQSNYNRQHGKLADTRQPFHRNRKPALQHQRPYHDACNGCMSVIATINELLCQTDQACY